MAAPASGYMETFMSTAVGCDINPIRSKQGCMLSHLQCCLESISCVSHPVNGVTTTEIIMSSGGLYNFIPYSFQCGGVRG